ncbi:hypothetical protein LR48_Vigan04g092900 [Vigna angularis]|uniref:Uncharacterized protein n=1 Tax=Phaseolus angularis TaxID=3914 RepID=A0A0L9UDD8_PHAAN|nr:hypothetical protein LR48_Vigan04g092900 [Vigna angularis]
MQGERCPARPTTVQEKGAFILVCNAEESADVGSTRTVGPIGVCLERMGGAHGRNQRLLAGRKRESCEVVSQHQHTYSGHTERTTRSRGVMEGLLSRGEWEALWRRHPAIDNTWKRSVEVAKEEESSSMRWPMLCLME